MERLRFDNLDQHLLLKNGNFLYRVPFRDGFAVLKVYFGTRTWWEYARKSLGNVLLCNQTSFMPRARRRTELDCLKLWRDAGFRVFDVYEDVVVDGLPEDGYALFEYFPGVKFVQYFADRSVDLEHKLAAWKRFLPVWHRRHQLAIERREPRLIHENGDFKHVMIDGDKFLFFDFEMCFRSRRRVREFVAREILAYLKSMSKVMPPQESDAMIAQAVKSYPDRSLLEWTWNFAFNNPNPVLRLARYLDRNLKARNQKPTSKYNVALKLREMLA